MFNVNANMWTIIVEAFGLSLGSIANTKPIVEKKTVTVG